MILPIYFLRDLQMQLGRKIAVACLFSGGMLVVIIDAWRLGIGDPGGVQKLDSLADVLEPCIAVIVACFPTYKSAIRFDNGTLVNPYKVRRYQLHSGTSVFRRHRLTARYHSEGYEVDDGVPVPFPAMMPRHNSGFHVEDGSSPQ